MTLRPRRVCTLTSAHPISALEPPSASRSVILPYSLLASRAFDIRCYALHSIACTHHAVLLHSARPPVQPLCLALLRSSEVCNSLIGPMRMAASLPMRMAALVSLACHLAPPSCAPSHTMPTSTLSSFTLGSWCSSGGDAAWSRGVSTCAGRPGCPPDSLPSHHCPQHRPDCRRRTREPPGHPAPG